MRNLELKISIKDWLFILFLSVAFSGLNSCLIYFLLQDDILIGIKIGIILGLILGLFSFGFVTINNYYLLTRIKNSIAWWILSAMASFLAGFLGFLTSFVVVDTLNLPIPQTIKSYPIKVATIIGVLNYLTGLLVFLFVRMGKKKDEIEKFLLSSQIQSTSKVIESHFLVNTLNNIIELIHKDPHQAENYLIALTKFLREIIKMKPLITLEDELDIIRKYIHLENLRKRGRIKFSEEIKEDALKKALLPKLSLQVLVENAIHHGYDGQRELNIKLICKRVHKKLSLTLINDGLPIKEFEKKIGLKTLEKRIQLYGGTFKIESYNPVSFIIELPLQFHHE
ncbi:histidine kinase [Caldimicrobium thiodismutans]|jgi:LytS/YehU family sensor histidine kinase|uniref:Histidine kinase n=1 Tax=Caldimicrobium thiodismutans TaxID=1653476 RepID=A0A0U5AGN2_9BACT|nr:histidine kinase [Caldimicrobium thiodismutans]BAU23159.1 histidine kinase [Caldimicrobium thiodismutans]